MADGYARARRRQVCATSASEQYSQLPMQARLGKISAWLSRINHAAVTACFEAEFWVE